jgi:hypothetical protein
VNLTQPFIEIVSPLELQMLLQSTPDLANEDYAFNAAALKASKKRLHLVHAA